MVGWHHRLNAHELGQTLVGVEGRGSLARCCPWGCRELDTTERPDSEDSRSRPVQLLTLPLGCGGVGVCQFLRLVRVLLSES